MSIPVGRVAWAFRNVTRSFDFWPVLDSIDISESEHEVATFSCDVVDRDGSLTFANEDKVRVTWDGTRIFAGHLKTVGEGQVSEVGPRVWHLEAQDFGAKLDDSVIDHPKDRKKESVDARIAWILS